MDEYYLKFTRIFNAEISYSSTVQKVSKICILQVNGQRCTTQDELGLQTLPIGQNA
jgi:hypothetical protein